MPVTKTDGQPDTPARQLTVDELIQQQTEALQALIQRKREEEAAKLAEIEANLTPEQRIMRAVNTRLEHMDAQIVKLGGHSYRLYDL